MKLAFWSVVIVFSLPVLFVVAIALGPVIVGILCAVGFGLVVFVIVNVVIGLATGVERAGSRLARHASGSSAAR